MQITGWAGVRARVERLRQREREWQRRPSLPEQLPRSSSRTEVFGAASHRFELAPPLSSAEVSEAEQQFGVSLPAEYRTFLIDVAAGGAGPYYGMFPLERGSDGRWSWVGDRDRFGVEGTDLSTLSTPFNPGDLRDEQQRLWAEQPDQDDAAHRDWLTRWDDLLWVPGRTDGAIYICPEGCGHRFWLAVSGPEQNKMWSDARGSDQDLVPQLSRTGQPMSFSTWYLEWLEDAEATVAVRG